VPDLLSIFAQCASTILPLVPVCLNNSPSCPSVPLQFSNFSQCASTVLPLFPVCLNNSPSCPSVPKQFSLLSQCASTILLLFPVCLTDQEPGESRLDPTCSFPMWRPWITRFPGISLNHLHYKNKNLRCRCS
jgi:hypothetical protein